MASGAGEPLDQDEIRRQFAEWRGQFFAQVREGIEAADNGDFASTEEIRAVADKYRRKHRPPFSP